MKRIRRAVLWALSGALLLSVLGGCARQQTLSDMDSAPTAATSVGVTTTIATTAEATTTTVMPTKMTDVNPAIVNAYKAVLQNEEKVYFQKDAFFEADTGKEMYLINYLKEEWFYESGSSDTVLTFTVIDMDGDGIPEVAVQMDLPGLTVLLHYYSGTVYVYIFGEEDMSLLKKDGSFEWVDGAAIGGVQQLKFTGETYTYIDLATYRGNYTDNSEIMTVNGTQVSRDEYNTFMQEWYARENVDWYAFSDANIAACFG